MLIDQLLKSTDRKSAEIAEKVLNNKRITPEEGVHLYYHTDLPLLGYLANKIREEKNGDYAYFNRNIHIEPTNICVYDCKFCSYSRKVRERGDLQAWEMSEEEILTMLKKYENQPITEVHIVGGVHPKMGLHYFASLIQKIKQIRPDIHVKAFTAVELHYMCKKAKVSYKEGLKILKDSGQDSLPGGGAEIFDEELRKIICADKCTTSEWLQIHETAHKLGMPSNATMLYGHIEKYEHRIHHMNLLRQLQDKTNGFNTFIPLKFRNQNNQMSNVPEVSIIEDLKNYAVSRIFMDNFPHLKAYWPMIGRDVAQMSLSFGVDDIDGTIDDTTKIYTMAGAEEQSPAMSTEQLVELIRQANRIPVERDTLYNIVKTYEEVLS
ncbi:MAG: aminofutalosine synthase MqnE [Bacteroidetes bacterium]|nr:MAG: aminofutalosine synthase MqnE [Bacteroidota bacterium]